MEKIDIYTDANGIYNTITISYDELNDGKIRITSSNGTMPMELQPRQAKMIQSFLETLPLTAMDYMKVNR